MHIKVGREGEEREIDDAASFTPVTDTGMLLHSARWHRQFDIVATYHSATSCCCMVFSAIAVF